MRLGHFLLGDLIGRSANDVYLADDLNLPGRKVAIKVAQADLASFPTTIQLTDSFNEFKKEATIVCNLRHPHILPLFEYGEETHHASIYTYLVMPYMGDGTLEQWVKESTNHYTNLLPLEDINGIIQVAAEALQYAHDQNVIHRDVKPSNFLIDSKSGTLSYPHILLSDFGIAKVTGANPTTTRVIGTFAYMAPEQWAGHPEKASDQYALAIIAYLLLTGRLPFKGNNVHEFVRQHVNDIPFAPCQHNPTLPADIDTVILCALAKNPADRYPSITQFATALQAAITPIRLSLTINTSEARTGVATEVTLPNGKSLSLAVPPHARNGQTLRLNGQGVQLPDGSRGTVIVTLKVVPVPPPPLKVSLTISAEEAEAGVTTSVKLPEGRFLPVTVPPHAQNGQTLRLDGQGKLHPDGSRGAVIVTLKVARALNVINTPINLLLVGVVLLVILVGGFSLYYSQNSHNQPIAMQDATATANAIAQARTTATSGPLLYQDTLQSANNQNTQNEGWDSSDQCTFSGNGYHVLANSSTEPQPCLETNDTTYQNITLSADMVIKSNSSSGGLLIHTQNNTGYFFEVSPSRGSFKFSVLNSSLPPIADDWLFSFAIHRGNMPNNLLVIVNGNHFTFYVNSILLKEITITNPKYQLSNSNGGIGFACYDGHDQGEAIFSNLKVYSSSKAS